MKIKDCFVAFKTKSKDFVVKHKVLSIIAVCAVVLLFASVYNNNNRPVIYDMGSDSVGYTDFNSGPDMMGMVAESTSTSKSYKSTNDSVAMQQNDEPYVESDKDTLIADNAKIVYSGSIYLRTYETEKAAQCVRDLVSKYSGYITQERSSENGENKEYHFTVRIPSKDFNTFTKDGVFKDGTVDLSAEDVTLEYSDTVAMLDAYLIEEKNLLSFLEKADNVNTMLSIEEQLREIRGEINKLKSRKNVIEDKVDYSTLRIDITQKYDSLLHQTKFGDELFLALRELGGNYAFMLEGILVFIIHVLPFATYAGIFIALIWFIVKKRAKRKKKVQEDKDVK